MTSATYQCTIPTDEENLHFFWYLPTPVKQQQRPGEDKSSSQTALNFPRTVLRNPWRKDGSDVTSIYGDVDGSLFSGLVNYAIFEALENHLVHISGSLPACGRVVLLMLETPVFTDRKNIDSTFREEPPKMAAFHGNRDSSCSIDDPG